ncbi:hypothetical protein YC2023_096156 [Brassica napus]
MLESCKTPCDLILLTTYMQIGWLYGSVTEQKISLTWMEIFITVCQSVQLLKDLLPLRSALGSVEIFLEWTSVRDMWSELWKLNSVIRKQRLTGCSFYLAAMSFSKV